MKDQEFKSLNFSMLGSGSVYKGDLNISGDAVINAHIIGSIHMEPETKLILEKDALIEGDINAHYIDISGEVKGKIDSSATVIIKSSAHVSGRIEALNLKVSPGAIINIEGKTKN